MEDAAAPGPRGSGEKKTKKRDGKGPKTIAKNQPGGGNSEVGKDSA